MSSIARGIKNTFRNKLRTLAFSIILAVSMSLAFSMLLANQAVHERGQQLRKDIGATLRVMPAGVGLDSAPSPSPAQPLSDAELEPVKKISHVTGVSRQTSFAAQSKAEADAAQKAREEQSKKQGANRIGGLTSSGDQELPHVSLDSAIGAREDKAFGTQPALPIQVTGTEHSLAADTGRPFKLTSGRNLQQNDHYHALVGKDLAEKNKLKVDSTFIIKDTTFTVVGIFDAGALFANNQVVLPFLTAREFQDKARQNVFQTAVVTVDSLDNLATARDQVKSAFQKDRADVLPLQSESVQVVDNLRSIETLAFTTLIVAVISGAMIILLTMMLVVRERAKEIAVLKAIGASRTRIIIQFLSEATVLSLIGAVVGIGFAALAGNAILQGLLSSKFNTSTPADTGEGSMSTAIQTPNAIDPQALVANISALVDWQLIVYGLGVAIGIALLGSAIPAYLITKIRPAITLRGN